MVSKQNKRGIIGVAYLIYSIAGVVWTLKPNLRQFTWEPAPNDVKMSGDLIHQWQQRLN